MFEQKVNPFFTPFELYSGKIRIMVLIRMIKDIRIIVWIDLRTVKDLFAKIFMFFENLLYVGFRWIL